MTEKGRSASIRERRIAVEIARCWRADAPLMRRGIILPRSVTNDRITCGEGSDVVFGGAGIDAIATGTGSDVVFTEGRATFVGGDIV